MNNVLDTSCSHKSPASEKVAAALEQAGCGPSNGSSWKCPAHDDNKPSLAVGYGSGKVLIKCHAGCDTADVVSVLGLKFEDLSDNPIEVVATYQYRTKEGELKFEIQRLPKKDFRARRPDPEGGWIWGLSTVERVLYRLPEVADAISKGDPIYVVEGEKDADALAALGVVATCNAFGAGNWRPEHTQMLAGSSQVRVVADKDPTGYAHAAKIRVSLKLAGIPAKALESPVGNDVSDLLAAGGTPNSLIEIDLEAKQADGVGSGAPPLELVPIRELLAKKSEPVKWLVAQPLLAGGTSILAGKPKTGKSVLARALALSVARGTPWLGFDVNQGPVFFVALEGREQDHVDHFRTMGAKEEPIYSFHGISDPSLIERLHATAKLNPPVLIVIDTIARLLRLQDGNSYAEVTDAFNQILALAKESGAHVMGLHHQRKSAGETTDAVLGSTAFAASTDTILSLRRDGARRLLVTDQRVGESLEDGIVIELDSTTMIPEAGEPSPSPGLRRSRNGSSTTASTRGSGSPVRRSAKTFRGR